MIKQSRDGRKHTHTHVSSEESFKLERKKIMKSQHMSVSFDNTDVIFFE